MEDLHPLFGKVENGVITGLAGMGGTEDPDPKIHIKDSRGLKSGDYSKKHIEGIIKAAKLKGVNPSQAVALALQESGLGTAMIKMRRGRVAAPLAMIHDFSPSQQKELDDSVKSSGIDEQYLKLAIALRDKKKYGAQLGFKDEATQLQAYNGLGKITRKQMKADKAYGITIPETGLDLKKNPAYGKRLIELGNDISANPDIAALLK